MWTAGLALNNPIQALGHANANRPITAVRLTASAVAVHATRAARVNCAAPTLVPTRANTPAPSPNASGYSTYSSRTETPKPASAAGPSVPTNAVNVASARLFRTGCSDIGAPTRRISVNNRRSKRNARHDSETTVRPDAMYQARTAVEAVNDVTVARPAPVIPSAGIG